MWLSWQVFRKRIEEHFEEVKLQTESQDMPELTSDLAEWIARLCDDVVEAMFFA